KHSRGSGMQKVQGFFEKPDPLKAKEYFQDGSYLWNSGIFLFKAAEYLYELKKYHPEIVRACTGALENSSIDLDFIRLDKDSFEKCPTLSIDYAVMEKTTNAAVLSVDIGWSDVGSWETLCETLGPDCDG